MDDWTWDFCPHCATEGRISDLSTIQLSSVAVKTCENEECPSDKLVMYTINRHQEDAPVPLHCLKESKLPLVLVNEPRIKFRHIKTIMWLDRLRQGDVYLLLTVEVNTLRYLSNSQCRYFYTPTPSVKKLLALTDEEVQVGKYIIPDLRRIILSIKNQINLYNDFRLPYKKRYLDNKCKC